MRLLKNLLLLSFIVGFISALNADTNSLVKLHNDDNNTTTTTPTTTTTTELTTTTTTVPTTTTTTTVPTTTTTTTVPTTTTTTTIPTTTTTTTVKTTTAAPVTTTTAVPPNNVLNFTIPKNTSLPTCLRARFSLSFNLTYLAKNKTSGADYNATALIPLENVSDFDGECSDNFNTLSMQFRSDWQLFFNYTLKSSRYVLDTIRLVYSMDAATFPDAIKLVTNATTEVTGRQEFAANKGNSYKCYSKTVITVNEAQLIFKGYQAEPFQDGKTKDFDTATECADDQTNTSELVPIIVGSALAVLVIFVLIAYIVGRRKHRPGYQQV